MVGRKIDLILRRLPINNTGICVVSRQRHLLVQRLDVEVNIEQRMSVMGNISAQRYNKIPKVPRKVQVNAGTLELKPMASPPCIKSVETYISGV